jgi:hypothetical protein
MKIKLFALSAVATFLFACGGGNSPEDITKKFHTAMLEQNYDKAAELATEKGKENINGLKTMGAAMGGESGKEAKKFEVKCDEVKGETVNCTCTEEGGNTVTYELVKKDDKWWVDYKKAGMDPEMTEPVMEEEVIEEEAPVETEEAPVE